MIKRHTDINKEYLLKIAYEQLGINYFILLGLSISKSVYKDVYYIYNGSEHESTLEAIVLMRHSGNLQLMCLVKECSNETIKDFKSLIGTLPFKELIATKGNIKQLKSESIFSKCRDGALISATDHVIVSKKQLTQEHHLRPLHPEDVPAIEVLYKLVFPSFTPPAVIREKLESQRGRGVGLFINNQLVSVAQTDFETSDAAIIVGVATHPDYQHKGYGHVIMSVLSHSLIDEGKRLILHYNDPIAGRLYDKMGFITIDQIGHYTK